MLLVVGVLGFVAGMYLLFVSHRAAPGADLADLLKKNPDDYNFSLGHVLDLTPRALGVFRVPLLGASLGLFLGTGLNWLLRRRRTSVCGQRCAGGDDGGAAGVRAFLVRYVFADSFLVQSGGRRFESSSGRVM